MKRDIIIFKPTGKLVVVHPNMTEKDGLIRLHNGATPGFQNSPFLNPYEFTFRKELDYELIKGVELPKEDTVAKDILANKERYCYNKVTGEFALIDTYKTAGFDRALINLANKVEELASTVQP